MDKHQTRFVYYLLIVAMISFMTVENGYSQSSENYMLKKSVVDQGGSQSQSAAYQIFDVVGQSAVVCTTASENYYVFSGFLYGNEGFTTHVDESMNNVLPTHFKLLQNYPNPFNPVTYIGYHLPQDAEVKLTIYDIQGRVVRELIRANKIAGYHTAIWDIKDSNGISVTSGIYFYRIHVQPKDADQRSYIGIKKMILIK